MQKIRKTLLFWIILITFASLSTSLWPSGIANAVEAPASHPPEIKQDVELFLNVYDAIFDVKRTKSKRAVQLWDAMIDQKKYKEVNLKKPYEFWNWTQARALRKNLIEQAHSLLTEGIITDQQKALWQVSKIDGYRAKKGGTIIIYTRYVRIYQKKNYFGFAIFKIKNAGAPLSIKKWNKPPYASNWKISEMHWKPITHPEYNKRVFGDYPIVK